MRTDFERIAIINRGKPAVRFIRAARQFSREYHTQLRTIVLYTTPDRGARFIREADESVDLGEATFFDTGAGQRKPAYLDHERVARALVESRADAVWVGWGFVSESPAFAELCDRMGLAFIGPDGESMRLLGDKISAKLLVRSEKLGEVAEEFDRIHSVHRALKMGSLDRIIPASGLRPYLIDAIERGMQREMRRAVSVAASES